jgi:hypothetical protein
MAKDSEKTSVEKTSKTRKLREGVENFVIVMNDHSFLFSVIPNGDKYTSLVTGVVSSIVKASLLCSP